MALLPSRKGKGPSPVGALQREMNRLFQDFFGRDFFVEPFSSTGDWIPVLDVAETDDAVIVKAELPGLDPKDVEVTLTGDLLAIRGEKKEEKEETTKSFHRVERSYGLFQRSVQLPVSVKPDSVEATYKNGVLTVRLAKREETRTKSVKIDVK